MKKSTQNSNRPALFALALTGLLLLNFTASRVQAANGTAQYVDFDDTTPGFGTAGTATDTGLFWSTSAAGTATATARTSGRQITVGSADTDFAGGSIQNLTLNLNGASGTTFAGLIINSTNVSVFLTGNNNIPVGNGTATWFVPAGSILTSNNKRQVFADNVNGLNWNGTAVTFQGGGIYNFNQPFGANSTTASGPNIQDTTNGTINLNYANTITNTSTYLTGFTLKNGTLNFKTGGSTKAFNGFSAGKPFAINGGTIDNLTGSTTNLTVGPGGYSIGGNFTFVGSSSLGFGTRAVALTASSTVTVAANTLTVDGVISGTGFGLTKDGSGTLALTAKNTYTGPTAVTNGTLVLSGSGSVSSSSSLAVSGATLDMSGMAAPTLANAAVALTNATITLWIPRTANTNFAAVNLALGGAGNTINISSLPLISSYPYTAHLAHYTALSGSFNIGLGSLPTASPSYAGYVTNVTATGFVDLVLTAGPVARTLVWTGNDSASPTDWSVSSAATNWLYSGTPTTYNDGEIAQFFDSAIGKTVSVNGTVAPGALFVSNNLAYAFNGGGAISGFATLIKAGYGTLTLAESGGDNFSGGITVSNGTVILDNANSSITGDTLNNGTIQIGNNDASGSLPVTGAVNNNGALVFTRTDAIAVPNTISGTGSLTQKGVAGTLTLSGVNSFAGAVVVTNSSTLAIGNASALGSISAGTTVYSGSTLDFNANSIGNEPVTVSGNGVGGIGALNNSGANVVGNLAVTYITLTGDTTFGASAGRWDLRSISPATASLSTGGNAYNLVKNGNGQISIVNAIVDPSLANIQVQAGVLSLEGNTTGAGNPASSLSVLPGAGLQVYNFTNQLNKVITFGSDGSTASLINGSGANTIVGSIALTNDSIFNVAGTSLTVAGPLTGSLLTKNGTGNLIFSGHPTHAGTVVNAGTVTINGLHNGGITNAASSTIAGTGTNAGFADVNGTLSPGGGGAFGTITMGGLTLESGGIVNMDLSTFTNVGVGINDLIVVNGNLTVNGNTITINPVGALQIGVPYRLFNYTGSLIWNSDLIATAVSGDYTFTINTNTPGQINVTAAGGPPVWNGGSSLGNNWSDTANWTGATINPGDQLNFAGTTRLNNLNDMAADTSYGGILFNAGSGAFNLNGNPIIPSGKIQNASTNIQTINLGLDFAANLTLDGGTGGLIIGQGLTNTFSGTTATTLTLTGKGVLTNLLNSAVNGTNWIGMTSASANWTVVDNAASVPTSVPWIWAISQGTFNFGTTNSAPVVTLTSKMLSPFNGYIGFNPGTTTFNMVNGSLTNSGRVSIGNGGTGGTVTVNVSGGTFTCIDTFQNADMTGGSATMNISSGTLNNNGAITFVASRSPGILNMTGTGQLICNTLDVSRSINSSVPGIVNLNGGTITTRNVTTASSGATAGTTNCTATFNFNGGTLKAAANSTTYFQGSVSPWLIPITAIVKSGGAVIDTAGFNISVLEPLQHDSGLGATPDGGLVKNGAGTLTLSVTNTYTGPTVVSNGTLFISGAIGATAVAVENGGTLTGGGSISSNVTVKAGGTLTAGAANATGNLNVGGNVTFQASANSFMEVNKTTATNDVVKASNLTYGGTLTVTNLSGVLTTNDSFKLFSATTHTGNFTSIAGSPGAGLAWSFTNGVVSVVTAFVTASYPTNITASVSGNQLSLTWPATHLGWILQTNSVDLANTNYWFAYPGSTSVTNETLTIDPAKTNVFFRLLHP